MYTMRTSGHGILRYASIVMDNRAVLLRNVLHAKVGRRLTVSIVVLEKLKF